MSESSPPSATHYRKKPVVIQAVQWWPSIERGHFQDDGKYVCRSIGCDALGVEYTVCDVGLRTMEGFMHIKPGYWIITGVKGERYACEPSIFEMTYEPASVPSETLKKFEQCSFCTMPPTCAMQGCALKNAAPQAAIRPDSGGQSSDTDAPAVAAPVSVPSAMGKPIPIAEATMPMLEALKAPCRHCGKRPIDTMDFS